MPGTEPINFLWYQLLIVLVAAGAVVIAATGLFAILFEMRSLRIHINSRMDQLLEIATGAAFARGQRAGPAAPPEAQLWGKEKDPADP
jgi:hypothetical protein